MRFAHPQFLWLLLILGPLLTVFLIWAWHRKQQLIAQFVPQRLLPQLTDRISHPRQQLRLALLGLSALCSLVALSRPQWGYEWVEVHQQGLDLVVAIDASRSMLAQDLPPNRLTRAKLAALDLARLSRSDRLALVPFAGIAYLQCPLTIDHEAFRQNLEIVSPDIMPQGGTSLAQAIRISMETLRDSTHSDKAIILISDGEDHDGDATNAARQAALAGIRIFTIGVGSPQGALLQTIDPSGAPQFIKDPQGNAVLSRLNEELLQQIAREANGLYVALRAPDAVETLVNNGLSPLTRSDQASRLIRRFHEQFHWPLGLAIAFLLIESLLSERRRAPRSAIAPARPNSMDTRIAAGFVALLLIPAYAASPAQALKQFEAGAFEEAEASYQELLQQRGPDPRLHYNRGTAAYRRGDFAAAARDFEAATTAPDLALQQKAYYNLGNALYRWGEQLDDDSRRIAPWNQALEKYKAALQLQPEDADAEFNLRFVQQQLEAMPPPPPTPSQGQESNDPSDPSAQEDPNPSPQPEPDSSDPDASADSSSPSSSSSNPPDSPPQPDPNSNRESPDAQDSPPQEPSPDAAPGDGESSSPSAPPSHSGPMSPEEANQLLDASRQEERPMSFAPPSSPLQPLKDW
jgi:Ca-activated chloride channel homolog